MKILSFVTYFSVCLAICILTLGARPANADTTYASVSLSNGGTLSGGLVYACCSLSGIFVDESTSWAITSSDGTVWDNTNVTAQGFGNLRSLSGASYLDLGVQTGGLDSTFTGTQDNVHFAIAGTLAQFTAALQALPFGQTMQIPLFTTVADGCANLGSCSDEDITTFVNGTRTNVQLYNVVGPAYLDITNDPGLYDVTLTSTPLTPPTPTPEPASFLILGTGLLGIGLMLQARKQTTWRTP